MPEVKVRRVPCDLCGSWSQKVLYQKSDHKLRIDYDFTVVQCKSCGLAFLNPSPVRESLGIFYPNEYYINRNSKRWIKQYEKRAAYIEKVPKGTLLDIGCARGDFIHFMSKRGYEVEGYEEICQENGYDFTIHHGSPESLKNRKTYDIVTSWAVFEHLTKPSVYFDLVSNLLKKDGYFILLVTNIDSLASRYLYSEDIPRHITFFSPYTLNLYLNRYGMDLMQVFHKNDIYKISYHNHLKWMFYRLIGRSFNQYDSFSYNIRKQKRPKISIFNYCSRFWAPFARYYDQIRKRNGIITAIARKW